MTTKTYTEIHRSLIAECPGLLHQEIDAAIEDMIEAGIEHDEEDELILTDTEFETLRNTLCPTSQEPPSSDPIDIWRNDYAGCFKPGEKASDLIFDGTGLRARGGLIYFG